MSSNGRCCPSPSKTAVWLSASVRNRTGDSINTIYDPPPSADTNQCQIRSYISIMALAWWCCFHNLGYCKCKWKNESVHLSVSSTFISFLSCEKPHSKMQCLSVSVEGFHLILALPQLSAATRHVVLSFVFFLFVLNLPCSSSVTCSREV